MTAGLAGVNPFHPKPLLDQIGIELFSLPHLLEKDFKGAIEMLARIGYQKIETFGPYTFSTDAAKESWSKVVPSVGFSGSGYFGLSQSEVMSIFKANKMSVPSMHTDLDTLRHNMPALADAAKALGATYVVLPAIPQEERKTLDDYKRRADEFNAIGAEAKRHGVRYGYHNHGYGLHEMEGQIPLHVIIENTDPELVFLEMDIYWTTAGGANPVDLLKAYPGRYRMMHLKDMKQLVHFSGDGGDPAQWVELFPYMTTAGDGVLDLKGIITAAEANGVEHFYVEQDIVADPEVALKKSFDYLQSLQA